VFNITQLADILPSLNLTNDKRLIALQDQLVNELTVYAPPVLKADAQKRSETCRKAEKIYDKVKGFLA
jgi:hypothetical protein